MCILAQKVANLAAEKREIRCRLFAMFISERKAQSEHRKERTLALIAIRFKIVRIFSVVI
jgi:hypothetical protein